MHHYSTTAAALTTTVLDASLAAAHVPMPTLSSSTASMINSSVDLLVNSRASLNPASLPYCPPPPLDSSLPSFFPERLFGQVPELRPLCQRVHKHFIDAADYFASAPPSTPLADIRKRAAAMPQISPCRFSETLAIAVNRSHRGDRGGLDAVKLFDLARGSKWINSPVARNLWTASFAACAHVGIDFDGPRATTSVNRNSSRQLVHPKNSLPSDPLPPFDESASKLLGVINDEVERHLYLGPFTRAEAVKKFDTFVSSSIFGIQDSSRSTTKLRLIHNLSSAFFSVNEFVDSTFTHSLDYTKRFFSALHDMANMSPAVWFACLDISRGYRRLRVRHQDIPLQGLSVPISTPVTVPSFDGTNSGSRNLLPGVDYFWFDTCLPFGLRSAPTHFCSISIAVRDLVRELAANAGVPGCLLCYVDDFAVVAPSKEAATFFLTSLRHILALIGLPENPSKAQEPSTSTTYLGVLYDGILHTATLPPLKRQLYIRYLEYFVSADRIRWSHLDSLVHRLRHAASILRAGKPFFSNLAMKLCMSRKQRFISLSDSDRGDLRWWLHLLRHHTPKTVIGPSYWSTTNAVELYTDASKRGFGAFFNGRYFSGGFSPAEIQAFESRQVSIAEFELIVVCFAIATWGHLLAGKRVTFQCDNTPSVASLNTQSSSRPVRSAILRHLFAIAAIHSIDLRAVWLDTKSNIIADSLSRFDMDIFHRVTQDYTTTLEPRPELASRELLLNPTGHQNPASPDWRPQPPCTEL